jgi:serine phosphatase RsbU (regulator of sigma subunit)
MAARGTAWWVSAGAEARRAEKLFQERYGANVRRTDRIFAFLMLGQWAFAILLAVFVSPHFWSGKTHVIHAYVYVAVVLGAAVSALPVVLAVVRPGWAVTRTVMAIAQMLWSGLLIHLSGGRIEAHFHVFGSLAILALYRDWRLFAPATIVVAADHFIRQHLWPESVYGVLAPESWRFLEHAFWVVFEDVFLIVACIVSVREMRVAAGQQTHIEFTQRLEREMEIASRIQTSILPRKTDVKGLEVAARMLPATEVGGDYYEILPVEGGCWIGIGDVAGHGLKAGLVMLQAQSAIEALVRRDPNARPRDVLAGVNKVLYENVRNRLGSDEHVTMSLLRWYSDGRLVSAGAHEEALIWRAETRRCERIPVEGTWLGAVAEIAPFTVERSQRLRQRDLLILYTDGVTEARNATGEMFGPDRLCALIEAAATEPVASIRDRALDAVARWAGGKQDDDVTLLVFRHLGVAEEQAAE